MSEPIERIHLLGISESKDANGKPAWAISMGYFNTDESSSPMVTANWTLSKATFDEAELVKAARHYFHGVCQFLGEQTQEWAIEKDAFEALKRDTIGPSSNTGKTA